MFPLIFLKIMSIFDFFVLALHPVPVAPRHRGHASGSHINSHINQKIFKSFFYFLGGETRATGGGGGAGGVHHHGRKVKMQKSGGFYFKKCMFENLGV